MRAKLKLITGRSNGMGYERRKEVLHQTIRGWVDSSGLNVPPVAETNVPGIAETNVPAVAE